jgi:uncharacterized protein YcgI (DUF1989 family)
MELALVGSFVLPKEQGLAFEVKRGQVLRVIQIEGPQVVDFNAFVLENFDERFCAGRTRSQIGNIHPKVGDALWSVSPYERVLFTIVHDTVKHQRSAEGAEAHDLLYCRCSQATYKPFSQPDHPNCHANLTQAIAPYGLNVDLRAEVDSLVVLSACPSGDLFSTNRGSNKPVQVEIYESQALD